MLRASGLLLEGLLTERGEAIEDAYFIREEPDEGFELLSDVYRKLPLVEALIQGLHGRGAVSVDGVLHFLKRHRFAAPSQEVSALRSVLRRLNDLGLVAYSNKYQSVRITAEPGSNGESAPAVRVIEPDRPYSNIRHLREILRQCSIFVWWAEPHLDRKALEPLADEMDVKKVQGIRLLSGPQNINDKTIRDFRRFRDEAKALGINAEWRVQEDRSWHDRFIISANGCWNVPPINTIYKGDYSEAFAAAQRPPFEQWWKEGVGLEVWADR